MNNSNLTNHALSSDFSLITLLTAADILVSEFERLLASELHLLKTGRDEGLEAIAEAKQSLVDKIGAQEAKLIELFEAHPKNDEVRNLKQRLMACRTENRNNYTLVMLELKHSNKSLELLRSVLRMDDLSLYRERGTVRVRREKRRFGSA